MHSPSWVIRLLREERAIAAGRAGKGRSSRRPSIITVCACIPVKTQEES